MPNVGPLELILVLVVALLVLGPRKLPSAGRALGQGLREFKEGITGGKDEDGVVARAALGEADERV
jgi:sec-independent protein translocase protein TatA